MRRLIAALGLLSFAHLVFAQSGGACPLSGERSHGAQSVAPSTGHNGHEGHAAPSSAGHEAVQEQAANDAPHAPACLMMGPCILMIDVGRLTANTPAAVDAGRVAAASDNLPASLTTSPDLPPPRA